ncbi:MAG: S1C family serine protease, partial [Chloroflexota bacterium]
PPMPPRPTWTERPPAAGGPAPEPVWHDPGRRDPANSWGGPAHAAGGGSGGRAPRSGIGAGVLAAIALGAGAAGSLVTVAALGMAGLLGPRDASGVRGAVPVAPEIRTLERSEITAAVEAVSPAIVTITARVGDEALVATDPFALPATGVGSGIIYDARGLVLTSRHVVCGADALTVRLLDGRELPAAVYGVDTLTDLAIVRIGGADDLPVARIGDSGTVRPGQVAIAIGSPMGTYTNSVTSGVVSATGRELGVDDRCGEGGRRTLRSLIQTDAAINPGNSGGALVDADGRVIGVNTAIDGASEGIGFAIPIGIARPIMAQAAAGKALMRPWIGIVYAPVTPGLADRLGLAVDYGVLVGRTDPGGGSAVLDDSPAARAGIRDGDLILAVNGERLDAAHPLDLVLTGYGPDEVLELTVLRGDRTIAIAIRLGTRPAGL